MQNTDFSNGFLHAIYIVGGKMMNGIESFANMILKSVQGTSVGLTYCAPAEGCSGSTAHRKGFNDETIH